MSELKRTPLYEQHLAGGSKLVPFAGWEMPVSVSGIIDEHEAVRRAAGMFDVSHMGRFRLAGNGADLNDPMVDLRDLVLEQSPKEVAVRTGQDDLGAS